MMDNFNTNKCCEVLLCQSTSSSTPHKLFIQVPLDVRRRNEWLRVAKRNPKDLAGISRIYFCEDHFDIQSDFLNYSQFKMGLCDSIEMVPDCLPTKFTCQISSKMSSGSRILKVPTTKKTLLELTREQNNPVDSIATSSAELPCVDVKNEQASKFNFDSSAKKDQCAKACSSNIVISNYKAANDLYELLKIEPATPIEAIKSQITICDFTPNTDKYYIPKKKSNLKVRTVRNLRKEFEQDCYSYLPKALENQQNAVLKRIMMGSPTGEDTQSLAKKILKSDQPILKSSWQMLMNINPENHQYSKQYVLWNGKCIQVNGGKGGKNKFICQYDLETTNFQQVSVKKKVTNNKKGLLQNSLSIKFKPGPLRCKKYLDESHQKYHVGTTELVSLPKPALDIQPFYGMTLESGVAKFVNGLRDQNGRISETWAEFAVTMLGTIKKSNAVKKHSDSIVTFDLSYKYDQRKILMRRQFEDIPDIQKDQYERDLALDSNDSTISSEIQDMLEKMLNSVEISLEQDNMYSGEDEPRITVRDGPINVNITKEKAKKRCSELGRLDVTVIRLPEDSQKVEEGVCNKSFCNLGCVCSSLDGSHNLKTHCGQLGCMFQCSCDLSRHIDTNILKSGCSDFIPGLLNLDSEIKLTLANEEQKFRQTVIVSGEKRILLKRQKRNWKASKKYGDFYANLNLKANKNAELVVSVMDLNLNCQDIEPWCMVHNLYKCFCKGRFTESSISECNGDYVQNTVTVENGLDGTKSLGIIDDDTINKKSKDGTFNKKSYSCSGTTDLLDNSYSQINDLCTRVEGYKGRKYFDDYYKNTHDRIRKMEQNDIKLKKRMMGILNNYEIEKKALQKIQTTIDSASLVDVESEICDKTNSSNETPTPQDKPQIESVNKSKLVAWLESSYKQYKQRINKGIVKSSLEPPVLGKLSLNTWEFLLKRYQERKNFFMVTKTAPFRIFIAVDAKSAFFENCININSIELADLHRFPVTVKNLLTSACESQEDFCILCGWSDCWEIIGSVSKLNDKCKASMVNENVLTSNDIFSTKPSLTSINLLDYQKKSSSKAGSTINLKRYSSSESSKWFVMTVENDFNEIQFYNRGFFVTYSSIIKAINVARGAGKTVRLSSQKCVDKGSGPQFGIYAIPDTKEYCVFVGPYEMHEHLDIETVINSSYVRKDKKTRGVWITTDKVDNGKLIDNPLSYVPFSSMDSESMVNLETDNCQMSNINYPDCSSSPINLNQIESSSEDSDVTKTPTKCMKPIKIRKTQDFYHIASNGALKKIFFKKKQEPNIPPSFRSAPTRARKTHDILTNSSGSDTNKDISLNDVKDLGQTNSEITSPETSVAETPRQVKITAVYSRKKNEISSKKPERVMFILKPEEINQKLQQKKIDETLKSDTAQNENSEKSLMDVDIDNFLANSAVCQFPEDEILEISDDSDDNNQNQTMQEGKSKKVWIQCANINNLGWIKGRINFKKLLSFEFPGFKATDFYQTHEAFSKINQVLSRKVYIPKNFILEWEVVESEWKLKNKYKLNSAQFGPDCVLTKQGIRNKKDLLKGKSILINANVKPDPADLMKSESDEPTCFASSSMIPDITQLEEESVILDNENDSLWKETLTNKKNILRTLSEATDESKQTMADKLQILISMSDE